MKIFTKKERASESLVFTSIISAITIILFSILNFVPFSSLIISLFFPLFSLIVSFFCKKKYSLYYFLVTLSICISFSFFDLSNLLFYLVPSMISGFIIAIMVKYELSFSLQILTISIISFCLSMLFVPIINAIYEIDFLSNIKTISGISNYKYIDSIFIPLIYMLSFIQSFFSYLFLLWFFKKYKIDVVKESKNIYLQTFVVIFSSLISGFSILIKGAPYLPLLFFFISLIVTIYSIFDFDFKKRIHIVFLIVTIILCIITYVLLYKYIPSPYQFIIFNLFTIMFGFYYLIINIIYNS